MSPGGTDAVAIRDERPSDREAIHRVVSVAFGRPAEANLVTALRNADATLLSLVAELRGDVVGHVLVSPVTFASGDTAAGLAPLAVLPANQRQGIGSELVRAALVRARDMHHPALFLLGEPRFYRPLGFIPAAHHNLHSKYPDTEDAFMVAELIPGALRPCTGLVLYHRAFDVL